MAYKIPESVLVIIHTAKLDVLLIERADRPGYWQSVTGSKDALDELPAYTAMREVGEETGILVQPPGQPDDGQTFHVPFSNLLDWQQSIVYTIYPEWRYRYAPGVTENTEHHFSLEVPEEIEIKLSPREHTQFVWLPYEQAAEKCFSYSNANAIRQLPEKLLKRRM